METNVAQWLADYGLLAVFVTVAIDHTGIPVPLVAFAMLAVSHDLNIHLVALVAFAGAMVSDYLLYHFGALVLKRLHPSRKQRMDQMGELGRDSIVVFGRYYPIVGRYMAAYWGAVQFDLRRFLYLSLLGNTLTIIVFAYLVYYIGNTYLADYLLDKWNALLVTLVILLVSLLPNAVTWWMKRR